MVGAAGAGWRAWRREGEDCPRCRRRDEIAGGHRALPDPGCGSGRLNARRVATLIRADYEKWGPVIKAAGVVAE